nr:MAG TPA: SCIMP protein [Caudoviricetes sp.]
MESLVGIALWSIIFGLGFYCVYDEIKEHNNLK